METNTTIKNNYSTPVAIVLAGLIIAGALYFGDSKKEVITSVEKAPTLIERVNIAGNPFIGDPNAKITLVEWSDYQCPACQYADQKLISPLVAEYVKNGRLKIVFKDFAFLGSDSRTLALTARAIWEAYPDKFYEWHKTLFDNQGRENTDWATKAVIDSLTAKVPGIDQKVIDNLLSTNSTKYQAAIEADKDEGAKLGVNATPSFILGDRLQVGVPQYASIKTMIDSLLLVK